MTPTEPTPPAFTTDTHSKHLFEGVPFHQLFDKDLSQLNEAELDALLKTTRANRVSPSVRKTQRTTASKKLSSKKKEITVTEDLSHLL